MSKTIWQNNMDIHFHIIFFGLLWTEMEYVSLIIVLSIWVSTFVHKPLLFLSLIRVILSIFQGFGFLLLSAIELVWNAILVFIFYELIHYLVNLRYRRPRIRSKLVTNPDFEKKLREFSYRQQPAVYIADSLPDRWKNSESIRREIGRCGFLH